MSKPAVKRHWLRENAAVRSPWRVLVVDTEATADSFDEPDTQVLRLWNARLVRRHGVDEGAPRHEDYAGDTAEQLAELVDRCARRDRTLWVFCHNLNYDLALTALPVLLTERGWRLTEGALTSDSPWCRMGRKGCRLTIADSWSWMPAGLEAIGELAGLEKLPLPAWTAPDDEWRARCARDVEVTALAIEQLMDWWDADELGNWSVTGPACGWSTYRHQRPAPRVLVDPSPEARAFEARAIMGGRRGVRRTGVLPAGLYADVDVATAHLTVMGNMPLPSRRFQAFEQLGLDSLSLRSETFDVLAECELDAQVPRYPWDSGRGVFYPTGRFRTVLAGPEIREARRRGELVAIGRGFTYLTNRHMQPWALWVAGLLDRERTEVPAVVRLLAKHWSRCVPGKWAGHTSDVVSKIEDPRPGWAVERGLLADGRRHADFLRLGHELWTIARDEWADDAFPAILAFIQGHTRVAVGRLLDELGSSWVSVNTDGAIVDARRWWLDTYSGTGRELPAPRVIERELSAWLDQHGELWAPFVPRIKSSYRDATVYGPQHLILSGERRLSGIPRKAVELADGSYRFTAWPKLRVQLGQEGPARYRTEQRTVPVVHIPPTGWLLGDGRVLPVELVGDPAAPTIQQPHLPATEPFGGLQVPGRQHPRLRRVAEAAFGSVTVVPAVDGSERPQTPEVAPSATRQRRAAGRAAAPAAAST